jgi:ribonuclease P protein component
MAERLSIVAVPKVESVLPCMPKSLARSISYFSSPERRELLTKARTIFRHPSFDVRVMSSPTLGRILIIASRKVGSAPVRNLVKRRLKALFYEEKLFELKRNIIVYLKKPSSTLSYDELKKLVMEAISSHSRI